MDNLGIHELLSGLVAQKTTTETQTFNNDGGSPNGASNAKNSKIDNFDKGKNGILELIKNFSGNLSTDAIGNVLTNFLSKKEQPIKNNDVKNPPENPPRERERRTISPSVNPLLSACKNHDDFVKRVLENNKSKK